jgi:YidC/Oxa1 family membrane protein insertase
MDKNTITGFVLIGIVLFAFSWLNRPTPEQVEAQRRQQDSIAKIEYLEGLEVQRQDAKEIAEDTVLAGTGLSDSAQVARMQAMYGAFAGAMSGNEGYTTLENDLVELRISNKGGHVAYARLKEYDNWEGEPLVLFDRDEVVFDFTLITATNRVINTRDMYFEPVKGNDPYSVTMRLATRTDSYLDFKYTLSPDDYRMKYSVQAIGLNGILSPGTNALDLLWEQDIRQQEKGRKFEDRYAALYYKFVADDV